MINRDLVTAMIQGFNDRSLLRDDMLIMASPIKFETAMHLTKAVVASKDNLLLFPKRMDALLEYLLANFHSDVSSSDIAFLFNRDVVEETIASLKTYDDDLLEHFIEGVFPLMMVRLLVALGVLSGVVLRSLMTMRSYKKYFDLYSEVINGATDDAKLILKYGNWQV